MQPPETGAKVPACQIANGVALSPTSDRLKMRRLNLIRRLDI
jgi:hypothetical protein